MHTLSLTSQIVLYVLLVIIGLYSVLLWVWQAKILKGRELRNCDGAMDSWRQQKTHYGIAFADVFVTCPLTFVGIILIFTAPRWGYYLIALVSYFWLWANLMTTATSLKFERPRINFLWILTYPFGSLVGLAYIVWAIVHFDVIYFP